MTGRFKQIINILNFTERKQAIFLLVFAFLMAVIDLVGLASIVPFISILTNSDIINDNLILNNIFQASKRIGVNNEHQFLILSGFIFLFLLIISLFMKALALYLTIIFTINVKFNIEKRLITYYLKQPYIWFLNRHGSDMGKKILSEVGYVVKAAIRPMIDLIINIILTIGVLTVLLYLQFKITLIVISVLGLIYYLIFKLTRKKLAFMGEEHVSKNRSRYTAVNDAFNAIKEIKAGSLEYFYINRFSDPSKKIASFQAYLGVLNNLPKFAIEAIAFGGLLLIVLFLMTKNGSFNNTFPIIGLFAFAGYRLIPLIQKIYLSINSIKYTGGQLDSISQELNRIVYLDSNTIKKNIEFIKEINLRNINFCYPNSSKLILKNINLKISAGSFIGIKGSTGSGKTTLIDIILGLLKPGNGKLEVDGTVIDSTNIRSWQKSIGYIPQQVFLSDDTIEANIAFGLNKQDVDKIALESAARVSSIHDFIINELPNGYGTLIGERGIRLSGGQRQRLGIARYLYHNPKILIMDEATNALDEVTENKVIDSILKIRENKTIILISHRLSSLNKCDKIFEIVNGEIKY